MKQMESLEHKLKKLFRFKANSLTNRAVIYSLAAALLSNCGVVPKNGGGENGKDAIKHEDIAKSDTFEILEHGEDTIIHDFYHEIFTQEALTEDSFNDNYHFDQTSDISLSNDSYSEVFKQDAFVKNDSLQDVYNNDPFDISQDSPVDNYFGEVLVKKDTLFGEINQDVPLLNHDISEEISNPEVSCFQEQYYLDKDEDGYGDKTSPKLFCSEAEVPSGYVLKKGKGWDCNDDDSLINPDAIEICDAADNNCNGKTDEGMTLKQPCGDTDVGECQYGVEINFCLGGEYLGWQICDAIYPKEEICDGKDNDCDGKTDEELLLQQKCGTTDVGECSYGTEFNFCVGKYTGWQLCDAVFPKEETCDNKDNNCNGLTDEMLTLDRECGNTDEGECDFGVEYKYCKNGVYTNWIDCTAVFPTEEKCNNIDDNCDGETDENLTLGKECGFNGSGECAFGTETNSCIGGQYSGWKNCTAIFPQEEVCDNLDNDCDGKTDEDLVLEQTCGVSGVGNCVLGIESKYCEDGEYTGWFDCNAVFPSAEVCNGLDDDCNGLVDEGLTLEQECGITDIGECTLSSEFEYCINGEYEGWLGCKAVFPTLETCDGLDNNCNGEADENFSVGEKCSEGEGICKSEGVIACTVDSFNTYCNATPGLPTAEKCDGVDNNCDGLTDENLVQTCYSICGEGTELCTTGGWMNCSAPLPELEICDYFDNDCDGKTDEEFNVGEVCYLGQGECKSQGTVECTADGFDTYCTAVSKEMKTETCNNLDDNCNGLTDENLTQSCSTACGNGLENCINGKWENCTAPQPKVEVCDGKDNDCNGKIDELVECCPLVGYWNFDEGAGNVAHDSSGKGNNGAISGATWTTGKINNALNFDGAWDYVSLTYYFNNLGLDGSLCMWFKSNANFQAGSPSQDLLFSANSGSHNLRITLAGEGGDAGKLVYQKAVSSNSWGNVSSKKIFWPKDTWQYACFTFENTDMFMYINGELENSNPSGSLGMHNSATNAFIGSFWWGKYSFNGIIDDVKVYDCALTKEEILLEYNKNTKKN